LLAHDKFKTDAFHLCLKHGNRLVSIFHLGERVNTSKRIAEHRCALVFQKNPNSELIEALNGLRCYEASDTIYANDIDGIRMIPERFSTARTYQKNQNPFDFALLLK
jgi:hypothetical protein